MRYACLFAALLLAACAGPAPTPAPPATVARAPTAAASATQATPAPNRDAAQEVDPRRLHADLAAYRGWNVLVWGTARDVRPDGSLTLDAYGPNLIRQPLPVALPPATPLAEGGCYYVYAVVGDGLLRGYRAEPIVAGDKLATCGT